MAREIIIGYDESDEGDDALALGRWLCDAVSAVPVVLSVVEFPNSVATVLDVKEYLGSTSEALWYRVRSQLGEADIDVRSAVSESPAKEIFEAAEDCGAMAIVVGSTARGALGRVYPGSTAVSLMQGGPCAVAIAPRGHRKGAPAAVGRIAVAYDGSEESEAALRAAAALARRTGAGVTVISVVHSVPIGWTPEAGPASLNSYIHYEREAKERLIEAAVESVGEGVEVDGVLGDGDPATELAEASGDFDLMLAGSRGYGPLRRALLGTVTSRLARSARCPLLVFPRGAGDDPLRLDEIAEAPAHAG